MPLSPTYVRPEGDISNARYIILGEQPGRTEVRVGKPFKDPAGAVLDECMNVVQMLRSECHLRNVIMDLDDHISKHVFFNTGEVTYDQLGNKYMQELRDAISQFNGRVIIAVGNYALQALTNRTGVTKWRGSILPCTFNSEIKVVPCLHPATVIPPKNVYKNKLLIQYDLKRAVDIANNGWEATKRTLITNPTFDDTIKYLDEILQDGLDGRAIDYDIEVSITHQEVTCISFSLSQLSGYNRAISIPFTWKDGDRWSVQQEGLIWLRIAGILEDSTIRKRGQNIVFDSHFLLRRYGIKVHNFDDTMVAQGILMPDYPKGLDFITSIWTDHPYYKGDGKEFFDGKSWSDRGWQYNATDSMICQEAHPKQMVEIEKQGNKPTYKRQVRIIEPLTYMMERGTRVDMDGILKAYKEHGERIEILREELNEMAGQTLNANSPKQLSQYFYGKLGQKAYKKRGTGQATTDETAMKRLVRKGYKEAGIILEIRRTVKRRSTYLKPEKFDSDHRLRCSYNPVGTRYSRISSSKNIFGTGCVPPWTEVLTPNGWIKIEDLKAGIEVMQWSSQGDLSWTVPKIISYNFKGQMIKAESSIHEGMYTPDHRIPKISKRGHLIDIRALDAAKQSNWFLPLSGTYNGKLSYCALKLAAVVQADGSIEGGGIRFSFRKRRKIDRFLSMMKELEINYTEQSAQSGYRRFYIRTSDAELIISLLTLRGKKEFGSWLLWFDQETIKSFLDEVGFWDGHIRGKSSIYFSVSRTNATWITTIAHLCGMSATMNIQQNNNIPGSFGYERGLKYIYHVNIKPRDKACQSSNHYSEVSYNNKVYCLSTETSYFMIKYRDRICITGNSNMQNWPNDLMQYLLPDEGYAYYSPDLAQAENRIVAYKGNVIPMIEAFESGQDIHSLTGAMLCGLTPEEVKQQDDEGIFCSLGDGLKTWRFWGKKSNHGLNYDLGYRNFALVNEIPETDGKMIVETYHSRYPGIRSTYHQGVKNQLAKDRTLINLMGRRTLFLDKWGDAMFKEAYSCIPQGTVGDVINERGLNYIYYNTDMFRSVELLNQIHDSIGFQIPLSLSWTEHAKIIRSIKDELEIPLECNGNEFVIPVDFIIGKNLYKKHGKEISHIDFPSTDELLGKRLEELYDSI